MPLTLDNYLEKYKLKKDTVTVCNGVFDAQGINKVLEKFLPALSKILLLTKQHAYLEKKIIRAGYRVAISSTTDFTAFMAVKEKISEDCRMIVAVGESYLIDYAKVLASYKGLPLIAIPTKSDFLSSFSSYAKIKNGLFYDIVKASAPVHVIFDEAFITDFNTIKNQLVCSCVNAFDYVFSCFSSNKDYCANIKENAFNIIDEALKDKHIFFLAICYSILAADQPKLIYSSLMQAATAFEVLEKEGPLNINLSTGLLLQKMFFLEFEKPLLFLPPPDNNLRLKIIKEKLKIPEQKALKRIYPFYSSSCQKRINAAIKKHKDELLGILYLNNHRLQKIRETENAAIKKSENIILSAALAPDIVSINDTMLNHLKNEGLLDALL